MGKFHAARQPFYACAIAFCAVAALVFWIKNDNATGLESIWWLAVDAAYLAWGAWSAFYFYIATFADDEADAEWVGVPISKKTYYVGLILLAAWRGVDGLIINTSATGIESTYGKIWLFASIALGLFAFANYLSYRKTHQPVRVDDKVKTFRKAS